MASKAVVDKALNKVVNVGRGYLGGADRHLKTAKSYVVQRAIDVNRAARDKLTPLQQAVIDSRAANKAGEIASGASSAAKSRAALINSKGLNNTIDETILGGMSRAQKSYDNIDFKTVADNATYRMQTKAFDNAMSPEGTGSIQRMRNVIDSGAMTKRELAAGMVQSHFLGGDLKRNAMRIGGAVGTAGVVGGVGDAMFGDD